MTEDCQMRALAAEALNEELQDENERLRVELETAKSKLAQKLGGKEELTGTALALAMRPRLERWDVHYGDPVYPKDLRPLPVRSETELPLGMEAERIQYDGSIRLTFKAPGCEVLYYQLHPGWPNKPYQLKLRELESICEQLFGRAYGGNPPKEVHAAMLRIYIKELKKAGVKNDMADDLDILNITPPAGIPGALFNAYVDKLHDLYPASRRKAERAAVLLLTISVEFYEKLLEAEEDPS